MRLQIAACLLIVTNAAPLGASDKRPRTDVGTKYPFTLNELKASMDTKHLLNADREKAGSIIIAFTKYRDKVRSSSVAPCPSIFALMAWMESQQINNTKELSHVFPVDKSIVKQELYEVDPDTASSLSDQQLEKASELFKTWRNATFEPLKGNICKPFYAMPPYNSQPQTQQPASKDCIEKLKRCMAFAGTISTQYENDLLHSNASSVPQETRNALEHYQQERCANAIYDCFKNNVLSGEQPYEDISKQADRLDRNISLLHSGKNISQQEAHNTKTSAEQLCTYSSQLSADKQDS